MLWARKMSWKQMKHIKTLLSVGLLLASAQFVQAAVYKMPEQNNDLIGKIQTVVTAKGDTFSRFAEKYNVGYYELIQANPYVNPDKPLPGTVMLIPSQYILPNTPREGVVINLAEMRLYYYPQNKKEVWTFPVGIGRKGSQTPVGVMSIIEHMDHPSWHSPESIRVERAKEGISIPKVVPQGPDNPLGEYALRLSMRTYLIHGTNDNSGVGRRSSSGCIRMFPQDIDKLFHTVKDGESVVVISEPYKLGRQNGYVYLEAYLPIEEANTDDLYKRIDQYAKELGGYEEEAEELASTLKIVAKQQAIPQKIGQLNI